MTPTSAPLYQDWSFWTTVMAALALILSQLPPVRVLLRKSHLNMQPYDRLNVTHWLGNPIVNLHVQIMNSGGRSVRVSSLVLELILDDGTKLSLPAQSYSRPGNTSSTFLFTPFRLDPDQEWANFVAFFTPLNMNKERKSKQLIKELKTKIDGMINSIPQDLRGKEIVEVDEESVANLKDFFRNNMIWRPGEYAAVLKLQSDPERASFVRQFRFTLFEADVQDLEERTSRFKTGAGLYFRDAGQTEVYPSIKNLD